MSQEHGFWTWWTIKRILRRRYDSMQRFLHEGKMGRREEQARVAAGDRAIRQHGIGIRTKLHAHLGAQLGLRQHEPRPWHPRPVGRETDVGPVISIVTPSLNHARFLEQTIESIASQRQPHEHIVQDGGSTDGTLEILERWKDSLHHVESAPDAGQANAINRGFEQTSGEILAYLNSDDMVLPGALSFVAAYFLAHPDVDLIYSHRIIIDSDNHEIGRWILPKHDDRVLSWADYVPQETMFWRRRVWDRVRASLDESFDFAMDWDLLVRMRDAGVRMERVPVFLSAFRVHDEQKSQAMHDVGRREMARIRERIHERPVSEEEVHEALRSFRIKQAIASRVLGRRL